MRGNLTACVDLRIANDRSRCRSDFGQSWLMRQQQIWDERTIGGRKARNAAGAGGGALVLYCFLGGSAKTHRLPNLSTKGLRLKHVSTLVSS